MIQGGKTLIRAMGIGTSKDVTLQPLFQMLATLGSVAGDALDCIGFRVRSVTSSRWGVLRAARVACVYFNDMLQLGYSCVPN